MELEGASSSVAHPKDRARYALPRELIDVRHLGAEGIQTLPGRGPVYPNLGGTGTVLEFYWPPLSQQVDFYGSGWSGNKVLWWVAGSYRGPALIRGRQVDGTERVRFDRGRPPPAEILIPPGKGDAARKGARDRPSYTRVRKPGCYAYQVDGTNFSRVIVFEARVIPPPVDPLVPFGSSGEL